MRAPSISRSSNYAAGFEDFPLEDWNAIMLNLTGSFLGAGDLANRCWRRERAASSIWHRFTGWSAPPFTIYAGTGVNQPVAYSVSKHG
ncbi:MAG: hypothetical protein U0U33_14525 [Chitinophagaceae bacterium]